MTLHRYAIATAVATFVLLIAGGLVTSTDSGLAVPDWPLSYGTWFPPMVGGIVYEHGHRMIAAFVGLMILILAAWLWETEPRRWVRRVGYAAFGAVVVQGLLGGLTVLLLLPPQISIAHACLGQAVFCLMACLAYATSARWRPVPSGAPAPSSRRLRAVGLGVASLCIAQLVLGAVIRHTAPPTNAIGGGVLLHLSAGLLLAGTAAWLGRLAWRARRAQPIIWSHAARFLILLAAQLTLGFSVFLHRGHAALRTGHLAVGALVLAQAVVLAWESLRRARPAKASSGRRAWTAYLELTKPRLTLLVLVTTAAGFWLGMAPPVRWLLLAAALIGTALVAGGANALNEWMERGPDALMRRTQHRPIPSGRIAPEAARRFGWLLIIAGALLLAVAVNVLAAMLAILSAASYLLLYTPLKRRTALCTLAGAIPGALPPVIGWAAARNSLDIGAWALFWLLFVWQLPHFLALATLYRDDYVRAGLRVLPATEPDGMMTARQIVLYGAALVPVSLFPSVIGMGGSWYFAGALLVSLAFLVMAIRTALLPSPATARWLFRSSLLYLPLLLGLLVCDRGPSFASASSAVLSSVSRPFPSSRAITAGFAKQGRLPDFALTDHHGRPFTHETLAGRVWIAGFIFTRCAGQCPLMHQAMQRLQERLEAHPEVQLVSFSVDPEHDTVERLAAFARDLGATDGRRRSRGARWRFVTGPRAALHALAREGFKLGVGEDGSIAEPITHSVRLILVDQAGRLRGYYDATDSEAMRRLEQEARQLLERRS